MVAGSVVAAAKPGMAWHGMAWNAVTILAPIRSLPLLGYKSATYVRSSRYVYVALNTFHAHAWRNQSWLH